MCVVKVAAWWAEQQYEDFAAVTQPFFSEAKADNFTIDFLSNVKKIAQFLNISSLSTSHYTVGLFPPVPTGPPEHGEGSLEQHADSSRQEEDHF